MVGTRLHPRRGVCAASVTCILRNKLVFSFPPVRTLCLERLGRGSDAPRITKRRSSEPRFSASVGTHTPFTSCSVCDGCPRPWTPTVCRPSMGAQTLSSARGPQRREPSRGGKGPGSRLHSDLWAHAPGGEGHGWGSSLLPAWLRASSPWPAPRRGWGPHPSASVP